MIEEGILGECLRCSSSWNGLRISPLTFQYVLPRTTLLHSWIRESTMQGRSLTRQKARGRTPDRWSHESIISHRLLKPTKAENGSTVGCSFVIPCFLIQVGNDCFGRASLVTVKNHGRPPACMTCENREGTTSVFLVSENVFTNRKVKGHRPEVGGTGLCAWRPSVQLRTL